jgi:hypothetical protein
MNHRIVRIGGAAVLTGAVALAIPTLGVGSGVQHKNVHFTDTGAGAFISKTQSVFQIHDSIVGNGAAVITSTGATTDKGVSYYVGATSKFRDQNKFGKPNAQGIIPFTGSGQDYAGTGKLRNISSHYTFSGTYDPKTNIIHLKVTGTESY